MIKSQRKGTESCHCWKNSPHLTRSSAEFGRFWSAGIWFGLQAGSIFGQQEHSWRCCVSQSSGTPDTEGIHVLQGERGAGQGTEITLLSPPCILPCRQLGFSRDAQRNGAGSCTNPKESTKCTPLLPAPQLCSSHSAAEMFGFKAGLCITHNTWFPSPGQPLAQKYIFFHLCGLFLAFLCLPFVQPPLNVIFQHNFQYLCSISQDAGTASSQPPK